MIDEQKVLGLLQAKALGCLDADADKELQDYVDDGHLFPWEDLGIYQNTASLLPLTLHLEIPDPELKDRVALKLIKLSEELRSKKSIEEEEQRVDKAEELIEEEVDENVEEFSNIEELFVEPPIEVEPEPQTTEVKDDFNPILTTDTSINIDEVPLPDFESATISESIPAFEVIENIQPDTPIENLIEDQKITSPSVEEIKNDDVWIEPESSHPPVVEETAVKDAVETKPVEASEDEDKQPDFTKKSVAEKMYRAIEQDFDSLKYHYEESDKKLTRGLLISYVIIAVLLALLIFSFFKFSADINGLEREIKDLKKNTSSSLIYEQNINYDQYFFS